MVELQIGNGCFTWTNRRKDFCNIAENLDRFFFKGNLGDFPFTLESKINIGTSSDHFPIQLDIVGDKGPIHCPSKMEIMWFKDSKILELVKQWWSECNPGGSKMFNVVEKLKYVKQQLRQWNKDSFKNIFEEKHKVEEDLGKFAEKIINDGMDNEIFNQEMALILKLNDLLAKEELFWRQKSREIWLKVGDRNTKYFHNSTKVYREINRIASIATSDGQLLEDPIEIRDSAVDFFSNLLNDREDSNLSAQYDFLSTIPTLILDSQMAALNAKFTVDEIKATTFGLNPEKAPGPNGFLAFFFQKCWDFVGVEVAKAIEDSCSIGKILKEVNNTFISLIPKKEKSKSWKEFQPISLCNTFLQNFSKGCCQSP